MRYLYLILMIICCVGCQAIYVTHDYDSTVDFSQIKTFNYDFGYEEQMSEFDRKRFISFSDSVLLGRQLTKSETPDIWLQPKTTIYTTPSRTRLGIGLGGGGGNMGVSVGGGTAVGGDHEQWELTLLMIEGNSNSVIWEAYSESSRKLQTTPDKRATHIKKLVEKLYSKYPPKN